MQTTWPRRGGPERETRKLPGKTQPKTKNAHILVNQYRKMQFMICGFDCQNK